MATKGLTHKLHGTPPPAEECPYHDDNYRRLVRLETKLCKLMEFLGLRADGTAPVDTAVVDPSQPTATNAKEH